MLSISIPEREYFDAATETFITCEARNLNLEHSLLAISKWESKWLKPFLGSETKSSEEIYDYIRCMSLEDVDLFTIQNLSQKNLDDITNYIKAPMTATTINQVGNKPNNSREIITSELVYYWMVAYNIPFECQSWHINRLLMLINVCNIKNSPPKKEKPKETLSRNAALNAARKKAMNTSG